MNKIVDYTKLKKHELMDLVQELYQELAQQEILIEKLEKQYTQLKAKMSGKIGAAAGFGHKNPNVR